MAASPSDQTILTHDSAWISAINEVSFEIAETRFDQARRELLRLLQSLSGSFRDPIEFGRHPPQNKLTIEKIALARAEVKSAREAVDALSGMMD